MVKHAWGNATGDDFVAALTGANSELANSFTSFTEQAGIPRLNVSLVCDGKPLLKLSQSRFLPRGSAASPASLWQIPVTVRTPAGQAQLLLKEADGSLPLPDASCPAWVEANVNGAGYYRPVYAPGALATLMAQGGLSVSELLANLDDAQALSESGDLPLAEVLSLALRYAAHSRREVVDAALGIISRMAPLIADDQRDAYAALWQRAFGRQGRALGLTGRAGDSDDDRLIRARWLGHLVDAGHDSGLRAQAKEFAQAWLQDRQAISAADRGLVLRSAAVGGDTALFEALVKAALASTNRAERRDIYGALGHFQAPQLAQAGRMLWLSPQHDIRELMTAGRERDGVEPVADGMLAFVMAHLPELAARLPNESVGRFPRFFSGLCGVDKAAQVEQFFAPQMGAYEGGSSALKQALEAIRLCGVYRDLQQASLNDFMALR
jgi:alanyl aminopeptidase